MHKFKAAALTANMQKAARQAQAEHKLKWQRQAEEIKKDPVKCFAATMRSYQQAFAAALSATGSESSLDFQGFVYMVQIHLRLGDVPERRMRTWFDACDRGDGTTHGALSVFDFFRLALKAAAHQVTLLLQRLPEYTRDPLGAKRATPAEVLSELLVETFDQNGDAKVDENEFDRMAARFGFGDVAYELFRSIDRDRSGVIDAVELMRLFRSSTSTEQAQTDPVHDFVMAISVQADRVQVERMAGGAALLAAPTDTPLVHAGTLERLSAAVLTKPQDFFFGVLGMEARRERERAAALDAFKRELIHALAKRGTNALEIFAALDRNGDKRIRRKEMRSALRELLKVETLCVGVLDAVFDELDSDCSGTVNYDELAAWLRLADAPRLDAAPPPHAAASARRESGVGEMMITRRRVDRRPLSAREQKAYRETHASFPSSPRKPPPPPRDRFHPPIALAAAHSGLYPHITNGQGRGGLGARLAGANSEMRDTLPTAKTTGFAWTTFGLDLLWTSEAGGGPPPDIHPKPPKALRRWRDAPLRVRDEKGQLRIRRKSQEKPAFGF